MIFSFMQTRAKVLHKHCTFSMFTALCWALSASTGHNQDPDGWGCSYTKETKGRKFLMSSVLRWSLFSFTSITFTSYTCQHFYLFILSLFVFLSHHFTSGTRFGERAAQTLPSAVCSVYEYASDVLIRRSVLTLNPDEFCFPKKKKEEDE